MKRNRVREGDSLRGGLQKLSMEIRIDGRQSGREIVRRLRIRI